MPALLLAIGILLGDVILLKNGGKLEGVIIHDKGDEVVVRLKYATVELDRSEISSIEKKAEPAGAAGGAAPPLGQDHRRRQQEAWEGKFQQIPALVVEEGPLKNVPYMSFRSGNYEFNLYGDPDAPAGIELGVYNGLLKDEAAKKKCIETLAELMGNAKDAEVLKAIGLTVAKKDREGFTFEITPETAPDAFGAGGSRSTIRPRSKRPARRRRRWTRSRRRARRWSASRRKRRKRNASARRPSPRPRPKPRRKRRTQKPRSASARSWRRPRRTRRPTPRAATTTAITATNGWAARWSGGTGTTTSAGTVARPTPHTPRYYTPGYSRAGGGYRGGPRMGGRR